MDAGGSFALHLLFKDHGFMSMPCARVPVRGHGIAVPLEVSGGALVSFADFDNLLRVQLGKSKSDTGGAVEFLGGTPRFPDRNPSNIAGRPQVAGHRTKLAELINEISRAGSAFVDGSQRLAGKLRFAQAAAIGRFGR